MRSGERLGAGGERLRGGGRGRGGAQHEGRRVGDRGDGRADRNVRTRDRLTDAKAGRAGHGHGRRSRGRRGGSQGQRAIDRRGGVQRDDVAADRGDVRVRRDARARDEATDRQTCGTGDGDISRSGRARCRGQRSRRGDVRKVDGEGAAVDGQSAGEETVVGRVERKAADTQLGQREVTNGGRDEIAGEGGGRVVTAERERGGGTAGIHNRTRARDGADRLGHVIDVEGSARGDDDRTARGNHAREARLDLAGVNRRATGVNHHARGGGTEHQRASAVLRDATAAENLRVDRDLARTVKGDVVER